MDTFQFHRNPGLGVELDQSIIDLYRVP